MCMVRKQVYLNHAIRHCIASETKTWVGGKQVKVGSKPGTRW